MKTRKRTKIPKKTFTKRKATTRNHLSPQVLNLIDEYWDLVIEYQTKQNRFKQAFKDSIKWKKILPTYFAILPRAFPVFDKANVANINNPVQQIQKGIDDLRKDLLVINKEFSHIHSICEVESRNKYGLLHTLPSKKICLFESVYPNIRKQIAISKDALKQTKKSSLNNNKVINTHINKSSKSKKVRFSTKSTYIYSI
tara:strand:+ start:9074 stop:9667 length:594 start_codon:yes stop_codon:yes gene_type:complete